MKSSLVAEPGPQKRTYDFGIGGGFTAFICYRWAATIVQESGSKPSQRFGLVIGLAIVFAVALWLADWVLWRVRLSRPVRSGLWAGAVIGPYAGLVAIEVLVHPVWSQVIGLAGTVLAFTLFYFLDRDVRRQGS